MLTSFRASCGEAKSKPRHRSSLDASTTVTDTATPDGIDNGILGSVPGQYIGAAVSQCPDARTATTDAYNVTIDAGSVGRVLITCRRVRDRRFSRWFWTAVRAELVA